ncbi:MAG: carbon storage regulator [Lachnospiraceae bacterium]|nr:carbon storage regulator [Lachnospiraceae bacterium]
MLRMSVKNEEYLMIGDDVKIVFLGGGGGQTRIMIDAPKEINIVRSKAIEKRIQDPELLARMPKYYRQEEHPEKYKKKSKVIIVRNE